MGLKINETLQTGMFRKPPLPFCRLVGTVSNCADAVRLETAPTGDESVYLFLEFTINKAHYRSQRIAKSTVHLQGWFRSESPRLG